jgi:hypothetical protein
MRWFNIVLFGLLPFTDSAVAQTVYIGAGNNTCVSFAMISEQDTKVADDVFHGWAQGFMSGINSAALIAKGQVRDLSSKTVSEQEQFLREFCRKNPNGSFVKGVWELYNTLAPAPGLTTGNLYQLR